ncbi:hypothetical protein MUN77_01745 [Leucobacter allii]|uniref:HNH endonuclease n=1 Tax=Leucobacter allii TaxID=2932247 RepID=UPI001FCFB67F|nr:hypothetical protein [Leucobacter allii]UOR02083.1 hypothetical protein MUN77_01745 [Leucobacter allii]
MAGRSRSGWVARPTDRKETLPPDWWRIRGHVLKRDGHRCQHVRYDTGRKCGKHANQVDHINDRNDHSYSNLQSLCDYHHQAKTSSQGGTAAALKRRKDATLRHPGIR